jgi:probable F420-dependent oxidoreductase
MKFWQSVHGVEPEQLIEVAKLADALGFEGITCGDHLVKPADYAPTYLYSQDGRPPWDPGPDWTPPYADPWILGAVLAQATTRLRFMPYVYVLPMRDPVMVAKQLATAAFFSNDRILLGAGAGWLEEEFALVRSDWKTRGARMDEMLAIIALLLEGRDVEYHGRHYDLPRCRMRPVPNRRVPVLIGGHSEAALRRAARHDGWVGVDYEPGALAPILRRLLAFRREAEDEGRLAAGAGAGVGASARPFEVFAVLKRFPDLDGLRRLADLGVTMTQDYAWFYKGERASTLARKRETMERFAGETIEGFARARARG